MPSNLINTGSKDAPLKGISKVRVRDRGKSGIYRIHVEVVGSHTGGNIFDALSKGRDAHAQSKKMVFPQYEGKLTQTDSLSLLKGAKIKTTIAKRGANKGKLIPVWATPNQVKATEPRNIYDKIRERIEQKPPKVLFKIGDTKRTIKLKPDDFSLFEADR